MTKLNKVHTALATALGIVAAALALFPDRKSVV